MSRSLQYPVPLGRVGLFAAILAAMLIALFTAFATPTPAQAQGGTTPPTSPPACNQLVSGTRFTLPAMTAGQEAIVPAVAGATTICFEAMEDAEGVALRLKGTNPYTADGNGTALTVSTAFTTTMSLPNPSFNGSLLKAAPSLPIVTVVAITDLTEGVAVYVGISKNTTPAPVRVEQWADVKIPGNIAELAAGTTKWSGNGVAVKVTSGAAFTANGVAVLNEPGKLGEFELYVDSAMELRLEATVNGQRFYLVVDANNVTTDNWLQKRVEPKTTTTTSTAGKVSLWKSEAGAFYATADCTGAPVVYDPAIHSIAGQCGGAAGDIWSPDPIPAASTYRSRLPLWALQR